MRAFRCATSVLGARLRAKRFGAASLVVMAAFAVHGQSPTLLLDNVRIIDGSGGTPVERGRIVIEGGRISRLGPVDQVPAPSGAETVDLAGRTVLPGLIDSSFPYRGRSEARASSTEQRGHQFSRPGTVGRAFHRAAASGRGRPAARPSYFHCRPSHRRRAPCVSPRCRCCSRSRRSEATGGAQPSAGRLVAEDLLPASIRQCEGRHWRVRGATRALHGAPRDPRRQRSVRRGSEWHRAHHVSRLRSDGADAGGGISASRSGKQRGAAGRTLHDVLRTGSRRAASAGAVRRASCRRSRGSTSRWRSLNVVRIARRRKRRRNRRRCSLRDSKR